MGRTLARLLASSVLLVCLSACTDTPAVGVAASASAPPASEPVVDEVTGAIAGVVVDDELVPVPDADVGLIERPEAVTKTDVEGRFTFNDLEAGSYSIAVQKLRYDGAVQKVTVVPGEVAEPKITIKAVAALIPRVVTYIAPGFIEFGWKVPAVGGTVTTPNVTSSDLRDVYYGMDAGATTAISAMTWQPNVAGTAKWMFLAHYLSRKACGDLCQFLGAVDGVSPILRRADNLAESVDKPGFEINAYFGLESCFQPKTSAPTNGAQNCTSHPDAIIEVALQQKMTVYTSIFYVDAAPVGYSPMPPK